MKISPSYIIKSIAYSILRGLYVLSQLHWFKPILRGLAKFFKQKSDRCINVKGMKMYGNTLDRIAAMFLWKYSTLEDYETSLMNSTIQPDMNVLDIGANIGYHTLQISKKVGAGGQVFAFEPDPENFRLLTKNVEANQCANVKLFQNAVSDQPGELKLYFCEENRGDHRIFDSGDNRKSVSVKAVKLDDLLPDDLRIDVIKIDIQGAEPLALKGMETLIARQSKLIAFCEFFPCVYQSYEYTAEQFLAQLESYGFEISVINDHKREVTRMSHAEMISMCSGERYINLYLTKG